MRTKDYSHLEKRSASRSESRASSLVKENEVDDGLDEQVEERRRGW